MKYTWGIPGNTYTVNGVSTSRYANPDITWEISKKTNLGVELGLFDKAEPVSYTHLSNLLKQSRLDPL